MKHLELILLSLILDITAITSYKILVIPYSSGFNSRLLNAQKIADILAEDGHDVTVLMNSKVQEHVITKQAKVINFHVPDSTTDIETYTKETSTMWNLLSLIDELFAIEFGFVKHLVLDRKLWDFLEEQKYDLIFGDALSFLPLIVAGKLNVPIMYYFNFLSTVHSHFFYPVFPSFICVAPGFTCSDEDMSFLGRVGNMAFKLTWDYYIQPKALDRIEEIVQTNGMELNVSLHDSFRDKIVVINAHYSMDTPMPTMPHVFPISGLFHKEGYPLPKEFSDIIKASQPHGTILMSFGTLVPDFDAEKADMFARVLGHLPHQIIWRFTGKPPKSLQPNTHLVKWFPQNDLLANPLVKMFITHCGISSTHESAHHGIPVLAVPLFVDQDGNAAKLTKRLKMGVRLDFYTLTEEELEKAVKEVLSNPVYSENAKKASYLLNDHVVPPQQQLRHLVNFTIKSGGAPHLFHPYALDMNWFQFYGLDVLCLILSVVLAIFVLVFAVLRACVKKVTKHISGGKVKQS